MYIFTLRIYTVSMIMEWRNSIKIIHINDLSISVVCTYTHSSVPQSQSSPVQHWWHNWLDSHAALECDRRWVEGILFVREWGSRVQSRVRAWVLFVSGSEWGGRWVRGIWHDGVGGGSVSVGVGPQSQLLSLSTRPSLYCFLLFLAWPSTQSAWKKARA
jgi:hypothetical protein